MHNRPDAPAVPVGPDSVELDSAYVFRTWVTDGTEHGLVWVRFDWGDGDTSSWCGPGETVEYSHSWREGGVFAVRAQARDDRTEWSAWSAPCSVSAVVPPYPFRLVDSVFVSHVPLDEVHVLPNGELIYVTVVWSASLSVVRASDLQLVAQIPFYAGWWGGGGGERVAGSPDCKYVYATDYRYEYLALVRTAGQVVVDSLGIGRATSLAISPDGRRLYVAVDADPRLIVVVRMPDCAVEDTIFSLRGGHIRSMMVAPDGSRLYAADLYEGRVCGVGLPEDVIEWQVPAWVSEGPDALVLHPNGDRLYTLEHECVCVRQSATGSLIGSLPIASFWRADIAPDGSYVYLTCNDHESKGALTVVRTSDNKVVRVIEMPTVVRDVAPSPDGQRLYVTGDNGVLYVLSR